MANFIVTYDLNGPHPSHDEMDRFLRASYIRGVRLCETVWWISAYGTTVTVRDHIKSIIGPEDLLLVAEVNGMAWTKLLVSGQALTDAWNNADRAFRLTV